ncbi:hypothetical protein HOD88_03255 [archaeon]|jgi:hypothetical protein|nr:hypothetical protein [archaeon]
MGELEKMCEQMGIAVPGELPLYSGVYESAGNDGSNRINFIKGMYDQWVARNGIMLPPEGHCFQTPRGIVVFDSFPEKVPLKMIYNIGVKNSRESVRISFPKEIKVPTGRITWTGRGQHFTIQEKD